VISPVRRSTLGLVVQQKLVLCDGAAQSTLERQPLSREPIHVFLIITMLVASTTLRVIHRDVGIFQQRIRVLCVIRIDGNANARRYLNVVCVNAIWSAQRGQYLVRADRCVLAVRNLRENHDKFVAAESLICLNPSRSINSTASLPLWRSAAAIG
jgi:hypothetical protein